MRIEVPTTGAIMAGDVLVLNDDGTARAGYPSESSFGVAIQQAGVDRWDVEVPDDGPTLASIAQAQSQPTITPVVAPQSPGPYLVSPYPTITIDGKELTDMQAAAVSRIITLASGVEHVGEVSAAILEASSAHTLANHLLRWVNTRPVAVYLHDDDFKGVAAALDSVSSTFIRLSQRGVEIQSADAMNDKPSRGYATVLFADKHVVTIPLSRLVNYGGLIENKYLDAVMQ